MQRIAAFFRSQEMGPAALDRQARAVWDEIAGETGSNKSHPSKVANLYNLLRNIQQARADGASAATVWKLVTLVATVATGGLPMPKLAAR
jgi:hypothetical protein